MIFEDREEAGKKLAEALLEFKNAPDILVIALPRGGVVIGYEIASFLHLPLDITCPRKIGAPSNPEYAIGAITENGEGVFSPDLLHRLGISQEILQILIEKEKKEAEWRLQKYRKGKGKREIENKRILLVDDGLATGATMRAAIRFVKKEGAKEVIVAVPVSPEETLEKIQKEADRVICLETPFDFYAVGQFYKHFEQVGDEEVIRLLQIKLAKFP